MDQMLIFPSRWSRNSKGTGSTHLDRVVPFFCRPLLFPFNFTIFDIISSKHWKFFFNLNSYNPTSPMWFQTVDISISKEKDSSKDGFRPRYSSGTRKERPTVVSVNS